MSEIVLMSDPKVAAVPVIESGERLVDVCLSGRLPFSGAGASERCAVGAGRSSAGHRRSPAVG